MLKWARAHGLSLTLTAIYAVLEGAAVALPEGKVQTIIAGHADGVFALLLAVVLKKHLFERGSPEADDPPEDEHAEKVKQEEEDTGRPPQG